MLKVEQIRLGEIQLYDVIYEISLIDMLGIIAISTIFLVIAIVTICATIYSFKSHKNIVTRIMMVIISVLFTCFSILFSFSEIFSVNPYIRYKNSDYNIVVGIIDKYERNDENDVELKYEQFEVDNIYFEYGMGPAVGYNIGKSHGYTLNNGKYVRISYIYDSAKDINIILKFEILNE